MPWTDAFIPIETHYKAEIDAATWGHLAPKKNISYKGVIRFAVGIYGSDDLNPTVIQAELKGKKDELSSSPWFYNALNDMLSELACEDKVEAGKVYEWVGTFRNYEFIGTIREMILQ